MHELRNKIQLVKAMQGCIGLLISQKQESLEALQADSSQLRSWLLGAHHGLTMAYGELERTRENLEALSEAEEQVLMAEYKEVCGE